MIIKCIFIDKENFINTNSYRPFDFINNIGKKCCRISKVWNMDSKFLDKDFKKYKYQISNSCDPVYNSNFRTIQEGEIIDGKPFDINMCNEGLQLGSCRKQGFECLDFMTLQECNKYSTMRWNPKTCNYKI